MNRLYKYYAIVYKGLEYPWILVISGGPGANSQFPGTNTYQPTKGTNYSDTHVVTGYVIPYT